MNREEFRRRTEDSRGTWKKNQRLEVTEKRKAVHSERMGKKKGKTKKIIFAWSTGGLNAKKKLIIKVCFHNWKESTEI